MFTPSAVQYNDTQPLNKNISLAKYTMTNIHRVETESDAVPLLDNSNPDIYHTPIFKLLKGFKL